MEVAIFKKTPSGRNLIGIWNGKSKARVVKDIKRAGVLTSGSYVAFTVSKSKKAFRIDGVPVNKVGFAFTH